MSSTKPDRQLPLAAKKKHRQVFVAYSYRLYPKADYRTLYKELEKAYDVTFIFADEKITNMHIMKKIESFIRGSDFSVFDISGWNPNVTLELGFAMALNDQWYIAMDPSRTEVKEVPSDLRGLDRIEYSSYSELREKLQTVMAQRYPRRAPGGIDAYLEEQRRAVLDLLRREPGLTVTSMAQVLGVDVQVTQLIVRPLVENSTLMTQGRRKATKYFLADALVGKMTVKMSRSITSKRRRQRPIRDRRDAAKKVHRRATEARPSQNGSPAGTELALNDKESAVLALLSARKSPIHLREIGALCFPTADDAKAYSWARNSVRRLVLSGTIKKVGSGTYAIAGDRAANSNSV